MPINRNKDWSYRASLSAIFHDIDIESDGYTLALANVGMHHVLDPAWPQQNAARLVFEEVARVQYGVFDLYLIMRFSRIEKFRTALVPGKSKKAPSNNAIRRVIGIPPLCRYRR